MGDSGSNGSHWTEDKVKNYYLYSYCDVNPPIELVRYLGKNNNNLFYNNYRAQDYDPPISVNLFIVLLNLWSRRFSLVSVVSMLKDNKYFWVDSFEN